MWNLFAYAGLGLAAVGLIWEITADIQLAAFKKKIRVLSCNGYGSLVTLPTPKLLRRVAVLVGTGDHRIYPKRQPFFFAAVPMLLLTFLLLRFTGVVRTESTMADKRPEYSTYQQTVPAFFPNPSVLWRKIADRLAEMPGRSGRQMGWWAVLLTLCAGIMEPAQAGTDTTQTWFFDVKIDGKDVGYHKFTANRDEDGFDVRAEAEFRYKIFGVTVFSYEHEVTEQYDPNLCVYSVSPAKRRPMAMFRGCKAHRTPTICFND